MSGMEREREQAELARRYEMARRIEAAQERFHVLATNFVATRFHIQLRRGTHGHRVT